MTDTFVYPHLQQHFDMDIACVLPDLEISFASSSAIMLPESQLYAPPPPHLAEVHPHAQPLHHPVSWPVQPWGQVCDPSAVMPYQHYQSTHPYQHQAHVDSSPVETPREPSPEPWYNTTSSTTYSPSLYASSIYSSSPITSSPIINFDDPHWTRTQLINRVMQVGKERRHSAVLSDTASLYEHSRSLSLDDIHWPSSSVSHCLPTCPSPDLSPNAGPFHQASPPSDIHICRWSKCLKELTSLDELITHISQDHIGSGKPAYYCEWEDCPRLNKPFMKRHKMHNHMRTHTGERPFACTVQGCDKRFSRLDSLNTHVRTHSNIRPFACDIPGCTKAYFHSRSLRKHLKSHIARDKKSRHKTQSNKSAEVSALSSPFYAS